MAVNRTSLSAGEIIREVLTENADVSKITRNIFPVVTDTAKLPYVMYRRASIDTVPTKHRTADTVAIEVTCYADKYGKSVELAEAVRSALDGIQASIDGLTMRSCTLVDGEEAWQDDAYLQQLIFSVKI